MNSKKLISLLSAAAMVASIVPAAVMAEGDTVLYSDSFNGYPTSAKTAEGTVFAVIAGDDYSSVSSNPDWQWIFNSPSSRELNKLTVGFEGARGDDTAAITINEDAENSTEKYLVMSQNRFQSRCKPQLTGLDLYEANAGESLVIDFKVMLTEGEQGAAVLDLGGLGTVTSDKFNAGEWNEVKLVTADGSTSVYVNDSLASTVSATPSMIRPLPFDSDTKCSSYATVAIDNLVILSSADGVNANIPQAEDHSLAEETTPAPAAPINDADTVTIDFDTTDFDAAGVTVSNHKDYTTVAVDETLKGPDDSAKTYSVAQTSSKTNSYGYVTFDFSSITKGKSHIIIDYDLYVGSDGRIKTVLGSGALTEGNSDNIGSLFTQGITKSGDSGIVNCKTNAWVHTCVDVDLLAGTGTYTVTNPDETPISSGKITTDLDSITTMSLVSWNPNTSYLDNIKIQTGGSMETADPTTPPQAATPEPASEVEGSNIDLKPEEASTWTSADYSAVKGESTKVLNHSYAAKAQAGDVSVYEDKVNIRGKSIFAAFDFYVNSGDELALEVRGSSDLGPTFTVTGNADGTATISALGNKGDKMTFGTVSNGTWYRALIEVPQLNNDGSTNTGNSTFTVSRIDTSDPAKTTETVVSGKEIGPRNLSGKGVTKLTAKVTGTPYIDNLVAYYMASGSAEPTEAPQPTDTPQITPEPTAAVEGSNIDLKPSSGRDFDSTDHSAVLGTPTKVLNHSEAKPAAAGKFSTYSDKVKGNSIFVTYDVYVGKGDKLTFAGYGNGGQSLGPSFVIEGKDNGAADVYGLGDKGDRVSADKTLAAETWYRVVIETPQTSSGSTGKSTYTVYRIDPADPTKTTEVAAKAVVGPRNLSGRGMTEMQVSITGTPYIDNLAAYFGTSTVAQYKKYVASYDGGRLKGVQSSDIADPSSVTIENTDTQKTFVWIVESTNSMEPYKAE